MALVGGRRGRRRPVEGGGRRSPAAPLTRGPSPGPSGGAGRPPRLSSQPRGAPGAREPRHWWLRPSSQLPRGESPRSRRG
eukprot:9470705-Pyramimonas_sp.AAC.1